MKHIAVVSGFWGQNIGNAFFNVGGHYLLTQMFPGAKISFIQDQPGYWTFYDKHKGNPKNDLGLLKYLKVDYIVLQGPLFTTSLPALWNETLEHLTRAGTKLIILSGAFFRHNEDELRVAREFLKKFKPVILSTRDIPTYEALKDCADITYCGMDSAFFVPYAYHPVPLSLPPYLALNYDRFPEPDITIDPTADQLKSADLSFSYKGRVWALKSPKFLNRLATRGKVSSYLGAWLDRRSLPETIAGFQVVRPEHRFNPHVGWKIYRHANGIVSDEPWTYFTIYANAELVVADRVHACVTALAFGRPAQLYRHTKRANLFDRVQASEIGKTLVSVDLNWLDAQRQDQIRFLKNAAASLS